LALHFGSGARNPRREVLDADEALIVSKQALAQSADIEPEVPLPFLLAEPLIVVEPVDVGDYALHGRNSTARARNGPRPRAGAV
jgi:hypothetical protein